MTRNKRLSNMELLRIFSMLFIITHHLIINGLNWLDVSSETLQNISLRDNIGAVFEPFVIIGVNLFFLLSGYFGIKQNWKKWINIVLTVYVYMIIIQGIGLITGYNHIDRQFIKLIALPFEQYWFLKVYLVVILVAPLLNIIIDNISQNKGMARYFLIIYLTVFCAYAFLDNDERLGIARGYSFISGCCLYLIGGFIHKNKILSILKKPSICFLLYGVTAGINALLCICAINILSWNKLASLLVVYNNPLVALASIFFFTAFARMQFDENGRYAEIIRFFSSNVLAVYIIHSSNKVVPYYRNLVLQTLMENGHQYLAFMSVIPYAVLIFIVCVMIDKIFTATIGRGIKVVSNALGERLDRIQSRICEEQ